MQLGVDVGGTNTDAAVLRGGSVVASVKSPTSANIVTGIVAAVRKLLGTSGLSSDSIDNVVIGTTHFTNAFVERRGLNEIAVIRLCLPAAADLPPMSGWPPDLRDALGTNIHLVPGGYEFDGREIAPFDEASVRAAVRSIKRKGLASVAISSVCSPINDAMERRAAEMVQQELPDAAVTLSGEIGKIGLIERENAAVMNASLATLSKQVVGAIRSALRSLGINAPFHLSQNDGTLMNADDAERYPVLTFSSGPTNSMRGAAHLSGIAEGIVVDIGGTTTDVGALVGGYPRETSLPVDIGGVRTNFRMPDIVSVGLGGGSIVRERPELTIGPGSVGFRLHERSRVFGGDVLTATDIVVAAGIQDIGDPACVRGIRSTLIRDALELMNTTVERTIEKIKTSAGDVPIILVGGGCILVSGALRGAERMIVPECHAEANAIGAAMAQVGGVLDRVYSYREASREECLADAAKEASRRVVGAGGDASKIEIVELEEIPLAYSSNDAVRIKVRAVSDLHQPGQGGAASQSV